MLPSLVVDIVWKRSWVMLRTDVGPYDVHTVSALLKKPVLDAANMANYRPVSNLSFISKVVERAVAIQLNEFWSQMICCHTTSQLTERIIRPKPRCYVLIWHVAVVTCCCALPVWILRSTISGSTTTLELLRHYPGVHFISPGLLQLSAVRSDWQSTVRQKKFS